MTLSSVASCEELVSKRLSIKRILLQLNTPTFLVLVLCLQFIYELVFLAFLRKNKSKQYTLVFCSQESAQYIMR